MFDLTFDKVRTEFVTRDWLANVEYFDSVQIALLKRVLTGTQ